MKILVACEYSGKVRDALLAKGHDAISCDLLPSETPGPHYQGDVRDLLRERWDMIIAFPPCTYLTVTGNKWFKPEYAHRFPNRAQDREDAVAFFMLFANHPCPRVAIENPVGIMSTRWRKPDQIIQPYQFGHPARKTTCLWLKGLPLLTPTKLVEPNIKTYQGGSTHSADYAWKSAKERGTTYEGVAKAMAEQWSLMDNSW